MAKPSARPETLSSPPRDGDGNEIKNRILLGLPPKELDSVLPKLEFVRLKSRHVLHESGETLKSAYFYNSGMFSVLSIMPDGKSVEVGLAGKEGFSGVPLIAGFRTSHTRTVVQVEGTAFRIDASTLGRQSENFASSTGRCSGMGSLRHCKLPRLPFVIGCTKLKNGWRDGC